MTKKTFLNRLIISNLLITMLVITGCQLNQGKNNPIGHFEKGPMLNEARTNHTATLLDDGNVLIAGGRIINELLKCRSAEIYITKENRFVQIDGLNLPRQYHAAIKLENGKVLFFGGEAELPTRYTKMEATDVIEEYDPTTQTFTTIGKMLDKRNPVEAVLLDSGKVFIYGGASYDSKGQWHCELYDPETNTSTYTSRMHYKGTQQGKVLVKLRDGRVFIKVGETYTQKEIDQKIKDKNYRPEEKKDKLGAIEIYNPETDKYNLDYVLREYRHGVSSTLLPDNSVLLANGFNYKGNSGKISTFEIFNPETMMSTTMGSLKCGVFNSELIIIDNKYVMFFGDEIEAYDLKIKKILDIGMHHSIGSNYRAIKLKNGNVLIVGRKLDNRNQSASELFKIN